MGKKKKKKSDLKSETRAPSLALVMRTEDLAGGKLLV